MNDVTFGFDPAGFRVAVVSVTLTNHTPRSERLQTSVEIESQGFVAGIDRDMTSEVPSGGSQGGAFSIRLDSTFTFDDAVLYIGRADRSRTQIPLGSAGELTTRVPKAFFDLGSSADDVSSITIDTGTVAWDIADPRGQAEVGFGYLHIEYTLDSTVETSVSKDTISLIDRNGIAIIPVTATIATVEVEPTLLTASFLVSDPPEGGYTLRYTERFGRGLVDVPFSIG